MEELYIHIHIESDTKQLQLQYNPACPSPKSDSSAHLAWCHCVGFCTTRQVLDFGVSQISVGFYITLLMGQGVPKKFNMNISNISAPEYCSELGPGARPAPALPGLTAPRVMTPPSPGNTISGIIILYPSPASPRPAPRLRQGGPASAPATCPAPGAASPWWTASSSPPASRPGPGSSSGGWTARPRPRSGLTVQTSQLDDC